MAARLKFSFLLSSICYLLLVTSIFAQSPTPTAIPLTKSNYTDEIHPQRVIRNLGNAFVCGLAGYNPFIENCYGDLVKITTSSDGKESQIDSSPIVYNSSSQQPGAIGTLGRMMAALYQSPPTSATEYLASLGENLGLAPQSVFAQVVGSGQGVIKPVLNLWQLTRNVAYLVFIIIFITVGFMIMFRQKINPQTVISAQQALPGLVVGLVLVTFSYFVASLMVDTAFLGTKVVAQVFVGSGLTNIYGDPNQAAQNSNVFQLFGAAGFRLENVKEVFFNTQGTLNSNEQLSRLIPAIIGGLIGGLLGAGILSPITAVAGAGLGYAAGPAATTVIAGLASIIVPLILLVALLIQFFRLLFALIGSYIQILVFTVAGPLFIAFSSIPGKGGVLSFWIKTILANSLVFPAVFATFMFAGVILGMPRCEWLTSCPNGNPVTLPLFGGLSIELLRLVIAFGIMLGTPVIPDLVRQAFGVKGPEAFVQAAIGGFLGGFGVGRAFVTGTLTPAMKEAEAYREGVLRTRYSPVTPGAPRPTPPDRPEGIAGVFSRFRR